MSRLFVSMLLGTALISVACSNYTYRSPTPGGGSVAVASEQLAHGNVLLRSRGIERLPTADERALHLGMTVVNDSRRPWQVDTRRETIVLPDGSERAPVLARSADAQRPVFDVPPGSMRTIDLYYALPPEEARASALPHFATRWQVETERGTMRGQTPFNRQAASGLILSCGAHASAYCLAGYS